MKKINMNRLCDERDLNPFMWSDLQNTVLNIVCEYENGAPRSDVAVSLREAGYQVPGSAGDFESILEVLGFTLVRKGRITLVTI